MFLETNVSNWVKAKQTIDRIIPAVQPYLTGIGTAAGIHTLGRAITGEETPVGLSIAGGVGAHLYRNSAIRPRLRQFARLGAVSSAVDQSQKYFQGHSSLDPISMEKSIGQKFEQKLKSIGDEVTERFKPLIDEFADRTARPSQAQMPKMNSQQQARLQAAINHLLKQNG